MMSTVTLKPNRDFSVQRHHPWIFSGAIAAVDGTPAAGEIVRVVNAEQDELGFGAFSPESQIRVRMWTFKTDVPVDAAFVAARIATAVGNRASFLVDGKTNAYRLVNAESDGLPGCVADRYGDWIVCQFTAVATDHWKKEIVAALQAASPCKGVYERSDVDVRAHEGLESVTGLLAGEEPPELIEIFENGIKYDVDVRTGHKTGFYLDQRDNREIVRAYTNGAEMLNAFSYTGGFGIAAFSAGVAKVTHVDLSQPALDLAKKNAALNECCGTESEYLCGNVFEVLRKFRDEGRSFDCVVLDPPKFAESKGGLMKAARGYKDINILGMKLLRPHGILATFSCSGLMTPDLFHKVVAEAAIDAHRDCKILRRLQQAEDHAESVAFPEGLYLKGLLCRVE